ncbi:TlpA family protein disulfide reductase [Thalassolituus sp. LLYu03]|uniref:TlpA family protein disulfide reductase n=1 Tax=Thalassolituus sp. LLYu03 TaxID=3421656 RepID=UPI003D2C6E13
MPSEPLRRWLRRLSELLVFVLLLTGASLWLSRHMLASGVTAPAVSLPDLAGNTYSLNWAPAPQTERTLVYFFAPWCGVCRISMPGLNLLPQDPTVQVVAIALDWETQTEVAAFVQSTGYRGTVLMGTADSARDWQIKGYPSYYVVSRDGLIEHADQGLSTPPGLWLRTQF